MKFDEFKLLSESYNVIPVFEKITADLLTPVSAYLKIRKPGNKSFLFESVEGIGRLARYSFIGKEPSKIISNLSNKLTILSGENSTTINKNIFDFLKEEIGNYNFPTIEELPDFTGGIIGYLGYENICLIEDILKFEKQNTLATPDSIFGIYETIIAFDHFKHQLILISNVKVNKNSNLKLLFNEAKDKLKVIKEELTAPINYKSNFNTINESINEVDTEKFNAVIEKIKSNIYEGDVFQLVISNRFAAEFEGDLLNVYRALRIINPSPYMYYMELEQDFIIIGTSPEDLLKVKQNKVTILPIAGTRKRGKTKEEDIKMEMDLLSDPKEIAEHMMLVDLARNDLGRVCEYNSVKLTEEKQVHKFSHVMHIVSRVEGELQKNKDCIEALKACFPAGTVTGAPKIRAMQLINEYENLRRNVYAGAIGYIDFSGNLDMCIAIRTLFSKGKYLYWQAGAGIVADSKPELEIKEIYNKSAVLKSALKYAEVIDENFSN